MVKSWPLVTLANILGTSQPSQHARVNPSESSRNSSLGVNQPPHRKHVLAIINIVCLRWLIKVTWYKSSSICIDLSVFHPYHSVFGATKYLRRWGQLRAAPMPQPQPLPFLSGGRFTRWSPQKMRNHRRKCDVTKKKWGFDGIYMHIYNVYSY